MTLAALARRLGIATVWVDTNGDDVVVAERTVMQIIGAFGFDTEQPDWLQQAHHLLDDADANRLVEPVIVAWDGYVEANAFARVGPHILHCQNEQGDAIDHPAGNAEPLPFGYYAVTIGDGLAQSVIISAPRRLPREITRNACVFSPLYALRAPTDDRFADLRELDELIAWARDHQLNGVLTLPLLAGFFDEPAEPSPYAPVSRSMWNELYVVVDREPIDASGDTMDYANAYRVTRGGIETLLARIDGEANSSHDLVEFLATHPDVVDYARFRAAGERYGRNWRGWPERLRNGAIHAEDVDAERVQFHCVAQWLMHTQLREVRALADRAGIALGLDLAIGAHADAFDVWRNQHHFALGCSVGAPPDDFFPSGQVWGFPPPLPHRVRADAYGDFRRALRHHLSVAKLLRVDHVMGLLRLFWIPDGAPPSAGTYVYGNLDDQLAVLCLEAHRAGATIVGENLGVVPPEINHALGEHGILGMHVAFGDLGDPTRSVHPMRASGDDLVTFGTHDMATFAGFVAGDDLAIRERLGLADQHSIALQAEARHTALCTAAEVRQISNRSDTLFAELLSEISASDSPWIIFSIEDLWGERRAHNVPGTTFEHPNWLHRAEYSVSTFPPLTEALVKRINVGRFAGGVTRDAPS